jgi:heme-degrading monooxygenase HmoA
MIARIWRGRVRKDHADVYRDYVKSTGIAAQIETEGNRGSYLLRRSGADSVEFLVLSLWDSMESIRRFAGESPEKAVYYPEDEKYLLELEPHVEHYEVF